MSECRRTTHLKMVTLVDVTLYLFYHNFKKGECVPWSMHDCSRTRKLKWNELELCFIKIVIGYVVLGKINLYHSDQKIMLFQFKLTGDRPGRTLHRAPILHNAFCGGGRGGAGQGCSRNC